MKQELLRNIIQARLEVKSLIEHYRGLAEMTGRTYEKEINALLDKLNYLDELERKIKRKK
jgi:hypothetical protein